MIRQPTTERAAFAWHRRAIADPSTPRHDGEPQCGFYKMRMVKGGPWVPAVIRLRQVLDPATGELADDERLDAEVDGQRRDPVKIWTFLRPITRTEYEDLCERQRSLPLMTATHVAVDLAATPILPGE